MKKYITEDGHTKSDCPVCEGSEHVDDLKDHGRCLTCRIEEEEEYLQNLNIVFHELTNSSKLSNNDFLDLLVKNTYFRRNELTIFIEHERENFSGKFYNILSTKGKLKVIKKYLVKRSDKSKKVIISAEKELIVTVVYLDFGTRVKKCSLYDLWDIDGTLADSLTSKKRKLNKPFKCTDSSGYKHIILIENQ